MSGSRRKPGPLGPFVDGYRAWLLGRGYSPSVVVRSLITLGHLGRWLERERARGRSAHRHGGEQPSWPSIGAIAGGCRPRASGRCLSIYAPRAPFRPSRPRCWRRLSSWSASTASGCFASAGWRRSRSAPASSSLAGSSPNASRAGDPRGVLGITAAEVNAFLVRECARVSSGSAGCCTYRLRSLLRYLAVRGLADPGLARAVPRVARWREATIPQFPTRPEIDRLLGLV